MGVPVVVSNLPSAYNTRRHRMRVRTSEGHYLIPVPSMIDVTLRAGPLLKVHLHDGRLSLETIHSTKRLRSKLTSLAGRPSMNFGDESRATAPASEHGPSSIDITSQEV